MNAAADQVRELSAALVADPRGVGRDAAATLRAGLAVACREAFTPPSRERHLRIVAQGEGMTDG